MVARDLRRKTYLAIPFLILSWSVMPILGLQNSFLNISSYGAVTYPENELGVFHVRYGTVAPEEASWVVAPSPFHGSINWLENPEFEFDLLGWKLRTPADTAPLLVDMLPGYVGNSGVMVSDELGYRGGLRQQFLYVPPNTTFHFKAMIKTVDVEALETLVLYYAVYDGEWNFYGGSLGRIYGSNDWTLYEVSFTTPNVVTSVSAYPALVYNRGEVWIDEASLIQEGYQPPAPPTVPTILNYLALIDLPITTEEELAGIEDALKSVTARNFWGIFGPTGVEEIYRTHIEFVDTVDTTYFGEAMQGYPIYEAANPGATVDDWKDEMYLRMIRGFYYYFSPLTNVGITWGGRWQPNWNVNYGEPATTFIQQNYDFIFIYPYTKNPNDWWSLSVPGLAAIEQLFPNQKRFLILTRPWVGDVDWETEVIALEMKYCFDRNIPVLSYDLTNPSLEEVWPLMLKARELYDSEAPYYENRVYGRNLLTGYVGETYGWVEILG